MGTTNDSKTPILTTIEQLLRPSGPIQGILVDSLDGSRVSNGRARYWGNLKFARKRFIGPLGAHRIGPDWFFFDGSPARLFVFVEGWRETRIANPLRGLGRLAAVTATGSGISNRIFCGDAEHVLSEKTHSIQLPQTFCAARFFLLPPVISTHLEEAFCNEFEN